MIAFATMLVPAAEKAGIDVPQNPDEWMENMEKFPQWYAFCALQLGAPVPYHGVHWDNAKVIASIPASEILNKTGHEIIDLGFSVKL